MVERTDGRPTPVASVAPDLCVSCGICAGSCAPMGVGPPGRDGRDQLQRVRAFLSEDRVAPGDVVVIACTHGAGGVTREPRFADAPVYAVDCAGNLHSSVVEYLVRGGAGGVLVAACPGRDCWNREGPRWTRERLFQGREAELQDRVDRRRVRMVQLGIGERPSMREAMEAFRLEVEALEVPMPEERIEPDTECVGSEPEPEPMRGRA
jgi:coenzyme F420-reducing hydrogenase delta subunit